MTPHKTELLHPYYDLGPVISQNAWISIIVGERGVGKTFGFLKRAIKRGIEFGEEFIYLRRYKPEMKSARANFFNELGGWFPDQEFMIKGSQGFWRSGDKVESVDDDGVVTLVDDEWKLLVHFITLANAQSVKSSSFYNVRQIIFDEFILENTSRNIYLPDEASGLLGFYKTVDRDRSRVRVYMLGNSADSSNPYFVEWDIRPSEMDEYTSMRKNFLFVHIANSAAFQKSVSQTPLGQFIKGTEFEKYAGQNQFLMDHNALLGTKPPRATPQWNLETRFGTFSAWFDDVDRRYYMQEKLIGWNLPMLTMLPDKMDEDRILVDNRSRILARVRTAYRRGGSIYYDTPRTRNAMLEVFRR